MTYESKRLKKALAERNREEPGDVRRDSTELSEGDRMQIQLISNPDDLKPYRPQWKTLLEHSTGSSPLFLSPEWIENWWKHFSDGRQMQTILFLNGNRLAGIVPLFTTTTHVLGFPFKILRFLGSRHADHLDFCFDPELRYECTQRLFRFAGEHLQWDVMDLMDVPEDSRNLPILRTVLTEQDYPFQVEPSILCPFLPVNGDDWPVYYANTRSKSTRKDLTRRLRRLAEGSEAVFRQYDDPETVREVFPCLVEVYEKRWTGKNLSLSFAGTKERQFYQDVSADLCRDGRLHLLTLEAQGQIVAFTLSAMHGTQFTWLITAYNPEYERYFPGEQILARLLESVFDMKRFHEFDFTRGEEPYKYKWTSSHRWNVRVLVRNRKTFSQIPFSGIRMAANIRREAKKIKVIRKIKLNLIGNISHKIKKLSNLNIY